MTLKFVFGLLLFLSPLLMRGQNLGFAITEGRSKVKIPIEVYNNLIIVPVVLNGKLPLKFILDTGVRTTILTEKAFSDFLHLSYARKYTIAGPGGVKFIDAYITNNVTIDIPGVHGEGHAMLVLDQDYLELRNYLGTDVHGILGYELFSRFVVQIDYEARSLTLMLPKRFKSHRKYEELAITVQDTKPYLVTTIKVNDSSRLEAKLLIDTGASHGLLLDPRSDTAIQVPTRNITSIIGRGLGGVIEGKIGRIKNIRLGKYVLDQVVVNFPDPNSYSDTLKNDRAIPRHGSMGGEILSRFSVILDFPHEKMYLKKNSIFKNEFHYNISGLTIKAVGEFLREFEITNVRDNTTANLADIQVGDKILTINSERTADLDLDKLDDILNSKPGKKVIMEIERHGKKMKREFYLQNQI
ncbi:MAG TPA: aspartyl protease family protein [Cyclobacteriaceae bacterium]|nr:aspartyl protease family protein [Cyclobacteriaceae bacterium]